MKNNNYRLLCILSLNFSYALSGLARDPISNTVDHKNIQLNLYLDLIKYNTQEKLGILPYILENQKGTYLEVGTGGDPIAELLSRIPSSMSPTIIASDIDENILKVLPSRHPQLNKYLGARTSGPQLKLQQLDATHMGCFADNSLSGINASAVVHEIVSYAGGIKALDTFFAESFRVLGQDGVLIYRDPESVVDRDELVTAHFKTPSIRLFTHVFLVKFLDETCGKLAMSGRKHKNYDASTIQFTFYKKNETTQCTLGYAEYLSTRSYEIDFSRQYTLKIPRGLCREIERHYLTYLHQCNPLVFVKCLPTIDSGSYFVNYLAHSTCGILEDFLRTKGMCITEETINIQAKKIMDKKIASNNQPMEYGILLRFVSTQKKHKLYALLKEHGFDPSIYILQTKDDECLLDYRIFGLLYDYINEQIFTQNNGPISKDDTAHAQWLKREGEETYVYYSDDELIARVAHVSLCANIKDAQPWILCPISANHNTFIPRLCYDEVLKSSIDIFDSLGYAIEIKEGKRIIHFKKMPLKNALPIYEEIIKSQPQNYEHLQQFLDSPQLATYAERA